MRHHHNSSSDSEHEGHHHHRHWRGRNKFDKEEVIEHKMEKKMFKLKSIFGEQPNFKEFIAKHSHLRPCSLIDVYAT